jgi:hypothetical protein
MRLKPASWLSWQVCGLIGLSLVTGAAAGAAIAAGVFMQDIEPLSREMQRRGTRIALLEMLVQQSLPGTTTSLADAPSANVSPQQAPAAAPHSFPTAGVSTQGPAVSATSRTHVAAGVPTALMPPRPAVAAQEGHVAAAPARAQVPPASLPRTHGVAGAPASPMPPRPAVAAQEGHVAAAPAPPASPSLPVQPAAAAAEIQPVTGEELLIALKAKVEGFAAAKAGVRALDKNAVHLRNGGVVRIGQTFPSGEKLLQVDPENNLVLTNRRQMLLFFTEGS